MAKSFVVLVAAVLAMLMAMEAAFAAEYGTPKGSNNNNNNTNSNNNNGNTNNSGNTNNGNNNNNNNNNNNDNNINIGGNGNGKKKGPTEKDFDDLPGEGNGLERHKCKAKSKCKNKILVCPPECPSKKPKKNKKSKGCFVDCNRNCEVVCKFRRPNCDGYGSLCYDPRFVGGDGVMFYFHGAKGGNFAIVSDADFQINAHFIGTRPEGRTRDFTWVQALNLMFDSNNLVIAAKRLSSWDDAVDALTVRWNGDEITLPTEGDAEWSTSTGESRSVVVERTADTNSVKVRVSGLVEMNIRVRPIGKEEDRVHNYQIPNGDVFAHLETQFKFDNLSEKVEGVLGKTYRPDYVSPAKVGVPMPVLGGEDKYKTPSLMSPLCKVCRFQPAAAIASA
ncbi:unnamed protein product [Linum trigynum]|uniref:Root cap n=1 Tax=Linum trigynum TaxID=586398 RepID=A0AAV2FZP0_9ROSI